MNTFKLLFFLSAFTFFSCNGKTIKETSQSTLAKGAKKEFTIPLIDSEKELTINIKINNSIEGKLTYDSRIPQDIILDSAFAAKNGLTTNIDFNRKITIFQIRKSKPCEAYISSNKTPIDIKTGHITKKIRSFYVINLKKEFDCNSDIIAGLSLFKNHIFEINYANSCLQFYNNINEVQNIEKYVTVNIKKINCISWGVYANLIFNDTSKISSLLIFDTGSPNLVTIPNLKNKKNHRISKLVSQDKIIKITDTSNCTRKQHFCKLSINEKITFPFIFEEATDKAYKKLGFEGIIGNGFLRHHNPIFNLKDNKLYLLKSATDAFTEEISLGVQLGFYFYTNPLNTIVTGVIENSSIESKGLLPKDLIVSIDGQNLENINLKKYLIQKPYNQDFEIKIERKDSTFKILTQKTRIN